MVRCAEEGGETALIDQRKNNGGCMILRGGGTTDI